MNRGRDRVVSVPLSEAEWQAFVERHPQPVTWLREQILGQIEGAPELPRPQSAVRSDAPTRCWSTRRV